MDLHYTNKVIKPIRKYKRRVNIDEAVEILNKRNQKKSKRQVVTTSPNSGIGSALNVQPFNVQPFNVQPFNVQPFNVQPFGLHSNGSGPFHNPNDVNLGQFTNFNNNKPNGLNGQSITSKSPFNLQSDLYNPFGSPVNKSLPFLKTPMSTPMSTPMNTPMSTPMNTPMITPMITPMATPMITPKPAKRAPTHTVTWSSFANQHDEPSTNNFIVTDNSPIQQEATTNIPFQTERANPDWDKKVAQLAGLVDDAIEAIGFLSQACPNKNIEIVHILETMNYISVLRGKGPIGQWKEEAERLARENGNQTGQENAVQVTDQVDPNVEHIEVNVEPTSFDVMHDDDHFVPIEAVPQKFNFTESNKNKNKNKANLRNKSKLVMDIGRGDGGQAINLTNSTNMTNMTNMSTNDYQSNALNLSMSNKANNKKQQQQPESSNKPHAIQTAVIVKNGGGSLNGNGKLPINNWQMN